jgi:hypothetical protein
MTTPETDQADQGQLAAKGSHEVRPAGYGLFAASGSQLPDAVTGYYNVWVRDNIMVTNSFRERGVLEPTIACMSGLTKFFEKQKLRFREIIGDSARVLKEDANRRPHIRFIQSLWELPEKWPHAQNDSLKVVRSRPVQDAMLNLMPARLKDKTIGKRFLFLRRFRRVVRSETDERGFQRSPGVPECVTAAQL